ncbi:hypothetical protein H8356DRAFT_942081, partial [Neocallimastix lanati (nom. inval.)]
SGNKVSVRHLIKHGEDINEKDEDKDEDEYGEILLFKACYHEDEELVKYLIDIYHSTNINK